MIRLDKYMCDLGIGSRSEVKNWIRKGMVIVDGEVAGKPEQKLDEQTAVLTFQGQEYSYVRFLMLFRPILKILYRCRSRFGSHHSCGR